MHLCSSAPSWRAYADISRLHWVSNWALHGNTMLLATLQVAKIAVCPSKSYCMHMNYDIFKKNPERTQALLAMLSKPHNLRHADEHPKA